MHNVVVIIFSDDDDDMSDEEENKCQRRQAQTKLTPPAIYSRPRRMTNAKNNYTRHS